MDWHPGDIITLVSVASTAVVSTSGQIAGVIKRRGDRKQESAQKLEERTWQAKHAALTTVIDVCLDLAEKCDLEPAREATVDSDGIPVPALVPERSRCLQVVRAMVDSNELLDQTVLGTVAAFSTNACRRDLRKLTSTIKSEMTKHANDLAEIRRNSDSIASVTERMAGLGVVTGLDHPLWEMLKTYLDRSTECDNRIVEQCDLDFRALKKTCESAIEEARKDLGTPS